MSLTNINNDNIFKKGVIGNVRKAQEDSHDMKVMTPNGDLFVVCDGMGGHVGGAKASSIAVSSIIEYLNKEKYNNIPQALSDAIQFANMQIIGFASANPEFKGMGTTACILLLTEKEAILCLVICAKNARETPSMPKVKFACSIGLSCPISASISTNFAALSSVKLSRKLEIVELL